MKQILMIVSLLLVIEAIALMVKTVLPAIVMPVTLAVFVNLRLMNVNLTLVNMEVIFFLEN